MAATTTPTTSTTEFDAAAKVRQIVKAYQTNAKLNEPPQPPTLLQMLQLIVCHGYMSAEQAHELYKYLTGGGYPVLPVLPFPGAVVVGGVPLYDLFRVASVVRAHDADSVATFSFLDDLWQGIVTAVSHITIGDVVDAIGDIWHSIFG